MMTQNYENKVLDKSKETKEETYIRVPDKDLAKEIEDAAKKDNSLTHRLSYQFPSLVLFLH